MVSNLVLTCVGRSKDFVVGEGWSQFEDLWLWLVCVALNISHGGSSTLAYAHSVRFAGCSAHASSLFNGMSAAHGQLNISARPRHTYPSSCRPPRAHQSRHRTGRLSVTGELGLQSGIAWKLLLFLGLLRFAMDLERGAWRWLGHSRRRDVLLAGLWVLFDCLTGCVCSIVLLPARKAAAGTHGVSCVRDLDAEIHVTTNSFIHILSSSPTSSYGPLLLSSRSCPRGIGPLHASFFRCH
jgi:hypothetical protein